MTVRQLLYLGNPELREPSENVSDLSKISKLKNDLRDTLTQLQIDYGMGRGLAAPQIGYKERVIYIQMTERSFFLVNPKIVSRSPDTFEVWDSCFSMKAEFFVKISRNKSITVEYLDEKNIKHLEDFKDGTSELLQHEIDHLDGVLCSDHLKDPKNIVMYEEWVKRFRVEGEGM
jgi:peptide deformylase